MSRNYLASNLLTTFSPSYSHRFPRPFANAFCLVWWGGVQLRLLLLRLLLLCLPLPVSRTVVLTFLHPNSNKLNYFVGHLKDTCWTGKAYKVTVSDWASVTLPALLAVILPQVCHRCPSPFLARTIRCPFLRRRPS